jgi:hypothetical protein
MLKYVFAASASLSAFVPLAALAASAPLLSGSYVYTNQKFCQMNVTVTYGTSPSISGSPFVRQVITPAGGSNTIALGAGTLKFTQTAAGAGSVSINGFQADGSPILLKETGSGIGSGGTDGAPLESETETGSSTFTQTATALTIRESGKASKFHIFYGKVAGGVAQSATFAGIDAKGCGEQYSLTHD